MHPDVPKIIRYPTFENTCALDPLCEDCTPLSQIKITCRGCQTTTAADKPDEGQILIYGAASPLSTPYDLELVAIWPDGAESSVQKMQVVFVDPLCDSSFFTDFKSPILRADVESKQVVSKTIGPFLDSAESCGGREFSVIGRCLSLALDDNYVVISLSASDDRECQTIGNYEGQLIINFDRYNEGQSIINFNYALDCTPVVELIGSEASVHDYVPGGPDLKINLGTWTPQSDCGGPVSSNLKFLDKNSQDWFRFDQNSRFLHVFGHPLINEGESFEFIYEALSNREVVASSVYRINFMKESQNLKIPSQENASKRRKLPGTSTCLQNNFPDVVSVNEFIIYQALPFPTDPNGTCCDPCINGVFTGCYRRLNYKGQKLRRLLNAITCTIDSQGAFDEASISGSQVQFNYKAANLNGGTYTVAISCGCGTNASLQWSIYLTVDQACSTTTMIAPSLPPLTIDQNYVSTTILPFKDTLSGITSPPTCGPRTCSSDNPKVIWNAANQIFNIQTLQTSDVAGTYFVTITCSLTSYPSVPPSSSSFSLTIVVAASCSTGNTMVMPTLPAMSINPFTPPTTIPAFKDTFSGTTDPPTCLARTCSTNNPNVVWDNTNQLFTVKSLTTDLAATSTVTLTCSLTTYPTVPAISASFQLTTAAYCVTGNLMTSQTLPNLTIDQSYVSTQIVQFEGAIPSNPCAIFCISDHPKVVWDAANQLFNIQTLQASDVAGTSTVTITCSLSNFPTVPAAQQSFSLTIVVAASCSTGNTMVMPTLLAMNINQTTPPITIAAFKDTFSGTTSNPPTCLARTCSSNCLNVVWDNNTQQFTVQSFTSDVSATQTVTMTCSLTNYPTVPAISASFQLTTAAFNCVTGNSMIIPTLPELTIDQNYVSTTILPFKDTLSGATSPPSCGARTCSSDNPHVVWSAANQLFTVSKMTTDAPGTYSVVTLTCSLTSYNSVPSAQQQFGLTFQVDCLTGNSITIPTLGPITINQTYLASSIPAFGDATSGTSSPRTCGVRTCTSNHPNVIWSDGTQAFSVQTLGASDVIGTFTVTLTCNVASQPTISGTTSFQLTIQRCLLTSAIADSFTGGVQKDYVISTSYTQSYPITVWFYPSACASTYTGFVSAIETTAGASTSQYATISPNYITISTTNFALAGIKTLRWWRTPTGNPSQPPIYFYFNLNLINPCLQGWTAQTMSPTSLVKSYLGPIASSSFTSFAPPYPICGSAAYTIIPAPPSNVILDLAASQIIVSATATTPLGISNYILRATSIDWPSATHDVPFTVQIDPCVVTSISTAFTVPPIIQIIFSAGLNSLIPTYTQTPACGYQPSYAVQATRQSPTVGPIVPSPPFCVLDALNMSFNIQSNDLNLDGTQQKIELITTIGTRTDTQSYFVTWVNPCLVTTFVAQAIADSFGFILSPPVAVNVAVPWLNDQANISNGVSTTQSICGSQSFVITENGLPPTYLTTFLDAASGQNFIKFASTDALMVGPHAITINYKLDLYPTVTSTATFTFIFYQLIAPVAPATTTYQVTNPTLDIPIGNFVVNPANPSMVITYIASLKNGLPLPVFIVFSEFGSGLAASRKLTLNTVSNSFVGTYQILVTATLSLAPQPAITQTLTFTLQVTAASQAQISQINQIPFFTSPIVGLFEFQYGKPWLPTYRLPPTLDPEGQTVVITIDYGTASSFLTYNSQRNEFTFNTTTTAQDIGSHIVTVTVSDPQGKKSAYSFLLKILDQPLAQQPISSNVTTTAKTEKSKKENLVLSVKEIDSLLETTISCNTTEAGILPCVTDVGYYYSIDTSKTTNADQSEVLPQRPTISVSRVNSRGQFFIKFSEAMDILALKNSTNDRQLQEVNSATKTETSDKYMYLLSPKHLRIEVRSENATKAKFTWYAKNITSTNIEMQLVFEDPLSISNDHSQRDMLVITVLPPALRYFKTLAFGAMTKDPLQTLAQRLPPQSILGTVMNSVSKVAEIMEESSQYTALANLATQLAVSGSMAQMWSMINAFQIVNTFNYLNTNAPGNVKHVMTNLNDMLQLSALETDQITSSIFNFTETQSPGAGFTEMGNDSKVLTAFIGNLFYIGVLLLLVYLLYGFVHGCGYSDRRCKRFDLWLQPKLIWSALICYQMETSLDFGIGTLLKFEEPNLNTTGEIFDLGLSIAAVICLLALPLTQVICLCKNKGKIDERKFKQKWGSLYSELKTFTPGQRETAIKMFVWFLFRRILTALNLVELRNQTIWLQLTLNMWLCLADACLIFHWSPHENPTRDIMEKFNGAVVLLLSQLVWMQTDLIPSPVDRYLIGWFYLGALAIMFLANISVVVISALKYPTVKFKRSLLKRKQNKARDKKLAQRNQMLARKQLMEAQKNGLPPGTVFDEPPIHDKRTQLVLQINALKREPRVDLATLKQLQQQLLALDKKQAEKWFKDGALINAKIKRYARSRTSTNGQVGAQPSKQIDNKPTKVKLRELQERQAAEAQLKEFQDQRQKELKIKKPKQLKEEELAKIFEEERQRSYEANKEWRGSTAQKIEQQMEEDAILEFARKKKIKELKRSDALYQQKNAVSFELNMWPNSNMQQIQQKREEDAILQFARDQKREELKRSDQRSENEQLPSIILFRKKYFEEEQRRIREQKALAFGWTEEEIADREYFRILTKLQNKEQISEQEMSVIDPGQKKPSAQLRRGTDAEFSFRAYK